MQVEICFMYYRMGNLHAAHSSMLPIAKIGMAWLGQPAYAPAILLYDKAEQAA